MNPTMIPTPPPMTGQPTQPKGPADSDPYGLDGRRSPLEMDAAEFASIGHRLVDEIAALFGGMRERPLTSAETPDEIRAHLDASASLPEEGTDPAALMSETTRMLVDHSLYNAHPRFFGYITAGAAPMGVLADFLASAVNPNLGAWVLSPMATEIEEQAVRWIGELVGYPTGDGVLTSGGNTANILAFWAARAARAGWDVRDSGMRGTEGADLRVYASAGTHTWIQKATDLSGMGAESIRWIEADEMGRLRVDLLRRAIEDDLEAGARPFLVVGTGGSVATGAVDPLGRLRELCDEFDLWFHVDGAYGAFAAAASTAPDGLRDLALADSVALDPHKWLYTPLEAGCTLVRDPAALLAAFSYRPDYYHFDGGGKNFFEHGIQNSRGFRALKVWLQLKQVGRAGYARMIDQDIELARRFHEIADGRAELEAIGHGLSITTYRYVPEELADRSAEPDVRAYLNDLNREVQARMERGGEAFVSNAVLGDVYALRMCVVNFRTTLEDVVALADITERLGREADAELRPPGLPA
jgi:glutamate/tyrosine decarboxylase-like PLP-dependent enzyme